MRGARSVEAISALLILIPAAFTISSVASAPTAADQNMGWLHTSGNRIETASGQDFEYYGAATVVTNYACYQNDCTNAASTANAETDGNWNEGFFATLSADGGNSVRVTLSYYNYSPAYTAFIDQVVNWCSQNNLYVILDLHIGDPHSTTGAQDSLKIMLNPTEDLSTLLTPAPGDPPYPEISWIGLLQYYAEHYADNPTVSMIDILNEPASDQANDSYLFGVWHDASQQAVNAIHEASPSVLVGVYGMSWGNSLVDFYNDPLIGSNIVYAAEGAYMGFQVGYWAFANDYIAGNYAQGKIDYVTYLNDMDIIPMSLRYPVVIMEWGSQQWVDYNASLDPAYTQWQGDALQTFAKYGMGSEYWAWDITGMGDSENGYSLAATNQGLLDYQSWMGNALVLDARGLVWGQNAPSQTLPVTSTSSSSTSLTSSTQTSVAQTTTSATRTTLTTSSTTITTTTSTTSLASSTVTATSTTSASTAQTSSVATTTSTATAASSSEASISAQSSNTSSTQPSGWTLATQSTSTESGGPPVRQSAVNNVQTSQFEGNQSESSISDSSRVGNDSPGVASISFLASPSCSVAFAVLLCLGILLIWKRAIPSAI
jgi:hypothetical protein